LLSLHYSNKEHDCRDKRNYEEEHKQTPVKENHNTNKKNEYYSSEDTVKVKIGEKLTWKRVVVFFDRCLFVLFFIISFITTVVFFVAVMYFWNNLHRGDKSGLSTGFFQIFATSLQ
jgi:hypothetical protein